MKQRITEIDPGKAELVHDEASHSKQQLTNEGNSQGQNGEVNEDELAAEHEGPERSDEQKIEVGVGDLP